MGGEEGAEQAASRCREGHPRITPDLEHQKEEYGGRGGGRGWGNGVHSPTGEKKEGKAGRPWRPEEECCRISRQLGFAGMERRLGAQGRLEEQSCCHTEWAQRAQVNESSD